MDPKQTNQTLSPEGDLPAVLRSVAAEVILDRGLGAFSLREVARRAGVSHAAPGYHFGDAGGLLTSLAAEGLERLEQAMREAAESHDDPSDRLTAIGGAYVEVAERYPAHCEVIFREDLIDAEREEVWRAGQAALAVLGAAITDLAADHNPDLDVDAAVKLCWSAMQGLVQIHPKLVRGDRLGGRKERTKDELVARFTDLIVSGISGR